MEWKYIKGFDGQYMVSKDGKIKSLNYKGTGEEKVLKPYLDRDGYERIGLSYHSKHICKYVHRLVAEAFIDNPNELETVDHIDNNKTNNSVENLRWLSREENVRKAANEHIGLPETHNAKPVEQYDINNNFIGCYASASEASRNTGIRQSNISKSIIYPNRYTAGGYIWKFRGTDKPSLRKDK